MTEILIGFAGPVTGDLDGRLAEPNPAMAVAIAEWTAGYGAQMLLGAELAVRDVNAAGGLLGRPVRLLVEDDMCDVRMASEAAMRLADSGVHFVCGHFCSSASIVAAKVYADRGVVQITPASNASKLTDERAGPGVFRLRGRDDQQGVFAAKVLATHFGGQRIAIVDDGSSYGSSLAGQALNELRAKGEHEAFSNSITRRRQDYSALVDALCDAQIDVVFFGGHHLEAALIVKELFVRGSEIVFVTGHALADKVFADLAGPAANGVLFTDAFLPDAVSDLSKRLEEADPMPFGYAVYAYAAVEAWAAAVSNARSVAFDPVCHSLVHDGVLTSLGQVSFDTKGDMSLPGYALYEWRDRVVHRADLSNRVRQSPRPSRQVGGEK